MARTRPTPTDDEWARIREVASPGLLFAIDALIAAPELTQEQVFASGIGTVRTGNSMTKQWFQQCWRSTLQKAGIDRPLACRTPKSRAVPLEIVHRTHEGNLTRDELREFLHRKMKRQVDPFTSVKHGHPGMGYREGGIFKPIRTEGTTTNSNGQTHRTFRRDDAQRCRDWEEATDEPWHKRVIYKTKEKRLTIYEVMKDLDCDEEFVRHCANRSGHYSLGERDDGSSYKRIRTGEKWLGATGRWLPLFHPADIAKIKKYYTRERTVSGATLISEVAEDHDVPEQLLLNAIYKRGRIAITPKRAQCSDGRVNRRLFLDDEDVKAFVAGRARAATAKKKRLPATDWAKRLGLKYATVYGWLNREWCTPLGRPLDAVRINDDIGVLADDDTTSYFYWWIADVEEDRFRSLRMVWLTNADLARLIGCHPKTVERSLRIRKMIPVLNRAFDESEVRKLPGNGRPEWRIHAAVGMEIARAVGNDDSYNDYRQRLDEWGGLAADVLATATINGEPWQPDAEPASTQPPPANGQPQKAPDPPAETATPKRGRKKTRQLARNVVAKLYGKMKAKDVLNAYREKAGDRLGKAESEGGLPRLSVSAIRQIATELRKDGGLKSAQN